MVFDTTSMMIFGFFALLSWYVSYKLKSKFAKYSQTSLRSNKSGAEVAAAMLSAHGLNNVEVIFVPGELTDHYNPERKTVNLSEEVYYGRNAAAVAVAAHECGHAIQHAEAYSMLQLRSKLVPAVNVASNFMGWLILGGLLLLSITPIPLAIAVVFFGITTLFSFVTLPVEFDASRRALAWVSQAGIVTSQEHSMAKDALWWAAMTYVVAALSSLASLIYYALLLFGSSRD
ncbi:MAG: zinc metallopeptidase [Bernardetiaceae bacterium]